MSARSWDEELAGSVLGVCIAVAVIAGLAIATTLIILLTELGRVYMARAFQPGRVARILWLSLVSFLGVWLVAGVLVSSEGSRPEGLYLGAWSFLLFTMVVLGVDWAQRQHEPVEAPQEAPEVTIEDLLNGGWKEASSAA